MTPSVSDHELFREEARQYRNARSARQGEVLRLAPAWTRWFFWLLIAVLSCLLLFGSLGSIYQYAEGPALLEVDGRLELTATQTGIVSEVRVVPYQRVTAGQLLVRFHDVQENAELDSARNEYDLLLVEWLRRPSDLSVRTALAVLRTRIEQARSRLLELSVRAPADGVVGSIRVRAGQSVTPGQVLVSLAGENANVAVVAMLPGHFRPELRPGMPLSLELAGYPESHYRLTIDSVDNDVVGPDTARRYLGREVAETAAIPGSVVLVRTRLPAATVDAAGGTHSLHDGMHGHVEVRVRRERILYTLFPGLKTAVTRRGG